VVIDRVDDVDGMVVVAAHPRARGSRCRRCGRVSTRVHSRYRRRLADLPVSGRPVEVMLTVRRFFCDHVDCSTCTFVEQVPGLTEPHARRSPGLQAALVTIGLALAGRAGSRLAIRLGMAVSRSTLLRLIRALPDPPVGQVTVLGVDEFALRRGHHYGTVLVDLADGHRPVDVLLGREAGDFADWLRAHPGVQVICRDRAGGYADGARDGAPDAVQVADRWHLWDNLWRHVERLVAAHHTCLPEPTAPAADHPADEPADLSVLQWPDSVRAANTRRWYQQVNDLREQGLSMRAIARRLDVNFKTVRRYVRAASADVLLAGGVQVSVLDPFKPYLNDRLADGERNATRLLTEITKQGLHRRLQHPQPLPATAAPHRRGHTREAATVPGAAGGTAGHRLDHRPAKQSRPGCCGAAAGDPAALPGVGRHRPATRPERRRRRADPPLQLRRRRRHRQPHQAAEGSDVRPRETRPAPQAHPAGLTTTLTLRRRAAAVKRAA
jgi:hypothetical protein